MFNPRRQRVVKWVPRPTLIGLSGTPDRL